MSSYSRLLWVLVLFGSALSAQDASCPRHRKTEALTSVDLFDGPPDEMAQLKPDVSRGQGSHAYASWDVGYIFDQGRNLFLVCKYMGSEPAITLKVNKKVRSCTFKGALGKAPAQMSCK